MTTVEPASDADRSRNRSVSGPPRPSKRRLVTIAAVLGAFIIGAGGGAAVATHNRAVTFVALTPGPIKAMQDQAAVAVKGQVAEIYGNKFVVQDDSGRALVDTGPAGDGGALVAKSETLTVQGRFEDGFIHAVAITHADGRNDVVGPPGPDRRRGPMTRTGDGPRRGFGGPPAPQG